jgi:hypothetical protein
MPLSKAKVSKRDVMRFWLGANTDPKLAHVATLPSEGFDLGLYLELSTSGAIATSAC